MQQQYQVLPNVFHSPNRPPLFSMYYFIRFNWKIVSKISRFSKKSNFLKNKNNSSIIKLGGIYMIQDRTIYFYHKHEPEIHEEIDSLKNLVGQYGFTVVDHSKEANIIASLGGDGTFLQAVRQTGFREDCTYIGISTTDYLSIYSDFQLHDAAKLMDAMTSQQMEVRRKPVIEVTIDNHTTY